MQCNIFKSIEIINMGIIYDDYVNVCIFSACIFSACIFFLLVKFSCRCSEMYFDLNSVVSFVVVGDTNLDWNSERYRYSKELN
jgi:hypothetical protein